MVVFFYGTTGELIKLVPLITAIPHSEQVHVLTNQQPRKVSEFASQINNYENIQKIIIGNGYRGSDIDTMPKMLYWYLSLVKGVIASNLYREIKKVKRTKKTISLVHGDTNTTVVGCLLSIFCGLRVGHIEAGLRSGSLRHPFPEEINRRIAAKICRIHFAPGNAALKALRAEKVKGDIVFTEANTACDSIKWALGQKVDSLHVKSPYAIASIHRTELLYGAGAKERIEAFIDKLIELSADTEVVFIDYPTTKTVIDNLGLDGKMKGITRVAKQDYKAMIHLLSGADFILTDSGGFQEDSYYLGVPCIVHRMRTERDEGLGYSAELNYYDLNKVNALIMQLKSNHPKRMLKKLRPTQIICEYFMKEGLISSYGAPK